MDVPTAAVKVGISQQVMASYFFGYNQPPQNKGKEILLALREEIPQLEWNQLLMSTILKDVEYQRPSPVVLDAVKSNAVYWLASIANQGQTDADLNELFLSLMSMMPMKW